MPDDFFTYGGCPYSQSRHTIRQLHDRLQRAEELLQSARAISDRRAMDLVDFDRKRWRAIELLKGLNDPRTHEIIELLRYAGLSKEEGCG